MTPRFTDSLHFFALVCYAYRNESVRTIANLPPGARIAMVRIERRWRMNPMDPIEAFSWMSILIAVFGLGLVVLGLIEWLVRATTTAKTPERKDGRVPPEELALLGEDWRDSVDHLFRAKKGGHE